MAEKLHVGRGTQWPLMAYISTQVTAISGCRMFDGINGTQGTCWTSSFIDGGHAKSSMGPKRWLKVVFFCGKAPCRRGVQWPLMAYIAPQVTVISGCSSLSGLLGPRAHTKYLSQALRGIVHARWVHNGFWRGSFFGVRNPHV